MTLRAAIAYNKMKYDLFYDYTKRRNLVQERLDDLISDPAVINVTKQRLLEKELALLDKLLGDLNVA